MSDLWDHRKRLDRARARVEWCRDAERRHQTQGHVEAAARFSRDRLAAETDVGWLEQALRDAEDAHALSVLENEGGSVRA